MSQSHVAEFVSLAQGKPAKEMGPAILYVNHLSMPDMLEGFGKLTEDSIARFREAAFDGIPEKFAFDKVLPEAKRVGIKRIRFAFDVAVKKAIPSEVPGDLFETGQLRDAYAFLKTRPPTKNVWVTILAGPCEDARLRERGKESDSWGRTPTILSTDQSYGQAGWDIAIVYGTGAFNSLPRLISERMQNSKSLIKKLGVNAHGLEGEVGVNGTSGGDGSSGSLYVEPAMRFDNTRSMFGKFFDFLNNVMVEEGSLTFHSCLAGHDERGDKLLKRISLEIPPRKVVGFTSLGYFSHKKQIRGSEGCTEVGIRDTDRSSTSPQGDYVYHKDGLFEDLTKLPWQSENSPHAKVAQRGEIVFRGEKVYS